MTEGSLYDRELAALAIKQARGDLIEAIFLLRAFRTTLPRFGASEPVDTGGDGGAAAHLGDLQGPAGRPGARADLRLHPPPARSATGGAARDARRRRRAEPLGADAAGHRSARPRRSDRAVAAGDAERAGRRPHPRAADFPADRDLRLQNLARGDEGFLLALGYSTQRGYGRTHPFAGEIRLGEVEVEFVAEELGFAVPLGRITVTECQMINQFSGSATRAAAIHPRLRPRLRPCERKAMAMALVDRALRARELGEEVKAPAQDEEFVLSHSDNVQATGFVEHLKLPHYVDFQAELGLVRRLRAEFVEAAPAARAASREAAE